MVDEGSPLPNGDLEPGEGVLSGRSEWIESPAEPGLRLHGVRWGRPGATPLVLLHGGGANTHWWDHLAPRWAVDREVFAFDFRGHGGSSAPDSTRPGAFSDDLDRVLEHLGRPDAVLVGHSMGGGVAYDRAGRRPGLRGLVLLDVARGGGSGGRRARRAIRLALSLRRTYPSREQAIERFNFLPAADRAPAALRRHIAERSVRQEPDGRWAARFDPRWFDLPPRPRPDAAAIRCPTLVVRGEDSALLSPERGREWAEELPRGRFLEIRDAGHHVLLEQPDAVAGAVSALLNEVDTAPG